MNFFNILEMLCTQKNIKVTTALKNLGYSTSKGTAWRNGSIPTGDILLKLSEYFNVSVDYLLTGKEKNSSFNLTDEELELLNKFRHLLDIDKGRILDRMETIYAGYSPEQKENVS